MELGSLNVANRLLGQLYQNAAGGANEPFQASRLAFWIGLAAARGRRLTAFRLLDSPGGAAVLTAAPAPTAGSEQEQQPRARRDRRAEDVTWIDQIVGKRDDVGADKAIVVSSAAFSEAARRAAAAQQVELRTVEQLGGPEVFAWLGVDSVLVNHRNVAMKRIRVGTIEEPSGQIGPRLPDDPVFSRASDGTMISLNQLWAALPKDALYADLVPNGSRVTRCVEVPFPDPGDRLAIVADGESLRVDRLQIEVELWIEQERESIQRFHRYRTSERSLAESVLATVRHEGQEYVVGLHLADGFVTLTLQEATL
jgi:Restriction endonuclease